MAHSSGGVRTLDHPAISGASFQRARKYEPRRTASRVECVKRAQDVGLAALALVALSPLFCFLVVLIRLTSHGPAFYLQERVGWQGRRFRLIKLRTMVPDAERMTGPVWACTDDPRRTRIGAFLRRTGLDELPQLWNVLRGEMSLVGPRPERAVFVEKFRQTVPRYMERLDVRPGITGLAQINGWRGNTSIHERLACDLRYVREHSPAVDLEILCRTLRWEVVSRNAC